MIRIGILLHSRAVVVACSLLLMICGCSRRTPSLSGVFSRTFEIDPAFSDTIQFGHRINLTVALHNPQSQPLVFRNLRLETSWKNAKRGSGSSNGGSETFTLDPNARRLIFCIFFVGTDIDHVDPMRLTRVQFSVWDVGGEDVSF